MGYTQKTGVPVNTVLPDFVTTCLEAKRGVMGKHLFWAGTGNLEVIVGSWQKRLRKLFNYLGCLTVTLTGSRDTFAVELLLAGVPLERVSILWVIKVFESQKDTTPPGQILGNAKSKQT